MVFLALNFNTGLFLDHVTLQLFKPHVTLQNVRVFSNQTTGIVLELDSVTQAW